MDRRDENVNEEQVAVSLAEHEQRLTVSEHRVKDLEAETKVIQELALSVRELAMNMKQMMEEQKEQGTRLKTLEEEPAKQWASTKKALWNAFLGAIGSTIAMAGVYAMAQYVMR